MPAETLRARAEAVLADPRFQRQAAAAEVPRPLPDLPVDVAAVFGVARLVLFVLILVVVILLAAWMVSAFVARRRRSTGDEPAGGADEAPGGGEEPLQDARRLAAQGCYGEAIHALLLSAIHQLSERAPTPPLSSRTSRELARLLPLKGEARQAFGELVAAVERSLFGGAPVGSEEFEANLVRFRAVVTRRGPGAAA